MELLVKDKVNVTLTTGTVLLNATVESVPVNALMVWEFTTSKGELVHVGPGGLVASIRK